MFFHIVPLCSILYAQLIITEIMYDLPGKDSPNEFVELLNISKDTVDLTQFEIRDIYARDQLLSYNGFPVEPGHFAIILEGDHDPESGIYSDFLAGMAGVYLVDDLSIGNGLSATDSLFIINSFGVVVDSLGWDLDLDPGFSYERILYNDQYGESIWSASVDSLGTPGRINSNTPLAQEGTILSIESRGNKIHSQNEKLLFAVKLVNKGIDQIEGQVLVLESGQRISQSYGFSLASRDTTIADISIDSLKQGLHKLDFIFCSLADPGQVYNSRSVITGVRFRQGAIRLSEFLPQQGSYEFEFIEVVNCSSDTIDMSGWTFSDNRTESPSGLIRKHLFPGAYFIYASDSSILNFIPDTVPNLVISSGFPGLNNFGDKITVLDPFDTAIDSLEYDNTWKLAPGFSLEHVLPCASSDWELSTASIGMTPGYYNSISPRWTDGKIDTGSFIIEPPNPEEYRSFNVCVNVVNAGEGPLEGVFSCTVGEYQALETKISIQHYLDTLFVCFSFPGMEAGFADIEMSLNILGDTIKDNELLKRMLVSFPSGAVKINEIFPVPAKDQSEFIELVSDRVVNLEGWVFQDRSGISFLFPDYNIIPGNYMVIAQDSSIIHQLAEPSEAIIAESSWPTLNNTEDELFIIGPSGNIIEKIPYDSSWSLSIGRSHERISTRHSSSMSTSWRTSVDASGSTPGRLNSVHLPENASAGYSVKLPREIFSPDGDRYDDFVEIRYYSPYPSIIFSMMIFNLEGILLWEMFPTYMPGEGIVSWDGLDRYGRTLPIGLYLIKINLKNSAGKESYETVRSVVLARYLK